MAQAETDALALICGFCFQAPEAHGDSDAGPMTACPPRDGVEHANLHGAIAEVLASGGPVEDELDAATEVMDLLVRRRIVPPPVGYDADLNADG